MRSAFAIVFAAIVATAPAFAENIEVVRSGKKKGSVDSYKIGDHYYLEAKDLAKLYGGQLYWYAVRGELRLSFRGRQALFKVNSANVRFSGKSEKLPRPIIERLSRAFIPIETVETDTFAKLVGIRSRFDPGSVKLLIDPRSNVGSMRWHTHGDYTRIVLAFAPGLRYQTIPSDDRGIRISIPNGRVDGSRKVQIGDGVVEQVGLSANSLRAELTVVLAEGAGKWGIREFPNPRRLVLDIERGPGAARAASVAQYMEAPAPAPAAKPVAAPKSVEAPIAPVVKRPRSKKCRVVLDAGHGGKDGGAVGRRGTLEKAVNLKAALQLAERLRANGQFDVFLTRKEDRFVKLRNRAKASNRLEADLFISLHANAHTSRKLSGYEVYFLSEKASDPEAARISEFENSVLDLEEETVGDEASDLLYQLAKNEFINDAAELSGYLSRAMAKRVDIRNRGVKQAAFYVLRGVNAPAVLIEMGFLTNSRDEAKLNSDKYRGRLIDGVYNGLVEFAVQKKWIRRGGR